ncbi:thiol peroxidase [Breznakia sp. PF5-3]|uniref:hypothetical protein n=1 Tax=unclassified Breznakia TaxID=2623764 RepID=UPI0024073C3B|nr:MULTISPECIES: hypothetical protein [unclassified Breznakia]MDF9824581.1 thiol peroxidase [Breznakia sp. PM6-1]MDF9835471.1 thiol peroxidase [Breznakia sp. PF5-3]MDF9837881.1 thiol peroxidase [Breznakia sp. PFB2-8]MDF9859826.1 thiol peroxidase [Breznakia sp. PH5-24]
MQKKHLYTRNLEPITAGTRLPNIVIFDNHEEEIDLHMIKKNKVYITVPSFGNHAIMNEIAKLDTIFKDFEDIDFYLISNEPVYTQKRLGSSKKLKTFKFLSDFKLRNFARYTGTYIYEISSLVKSIFIINEYDEIKYVQYYDDLYSNIDANIVVKELNNLLDI